MTTAEALVLAWCCAALNDHVSDELYAEVVRDADGVVRRPVIAVHTRIAGSVLVTVEEVPEPEEP